MSILNTVRGSLSLKVSLQLAVVVLLLTTGAAAVITAHETAQLEQLTLEKARTASVLGARFYGAALNHAIDAGLITVADAYDRNYVPIKGHDWGKSPRFHTRYDAVTDAAVVVFQDKFLDDPDFTFAIGMDENGYIPTHDTVFSQAATGNPDRDVLNNNKSRAEYEEALKAGKNTEGVLVQDYVRRRTGEQMWDVSAPIEVKGKHWGAFRVGVSKARAAAHARALLLLLAGVFAVFFAVTVGTMYAVVRGAMKPVVALTTAAEQISLGEALDVPIKPSTTDEIGRLTKQVDRLRASMKAAMNRLGHG
jgi:HAMP domain-containing protein